MSFIFRTFLLLSLIGISYALLFRIRHLFFQRMIGLLMGLVLCIFIVVPELSTKVANWFGITRGVDLVLYLAQVCWAYIFIRMYLRQQWLRNELTKLTRSLAIQDVQLPKK